MNDDSQKLDHIVEKIGNIDVTLAKQSVLLDEHIRRTNLLEEKMEPVERHMHMINGGLKVIGMATAVVGLIEAVIMMVRK